MRRIIKYSIIGETAINLKKQLEELKKERNKLLIDIDKINDGYKGQDALIIINKYKAKINDINSFIENMEKYQICFEWLSGNYRDSHNKAQNSLNNEEQIYSTKEIYNTSQTFGKVISDGPDGIYTTAVGEQFDNKINATSPENNSLSNLKNEKWGTRTIYVGKNK